MQAEIHPKLAAANAAFAQGRKADAADSIIAALDEKPDLPIRVYCVLIGNLLQLGRIDEGARWAVKAAEIAPHDPEIHNFIGVIFRMKGRNTDAIQALDRALDLQPEHKGALTNKGQILNDLKDGVAAEAIFVRLLRADPEAPLLHRGLAKALWTQRKYDTAAASLLQAIRLSPTNVDAWLDLSALTVDRRDPSSALAILNAAIDSVPDDARLLEAKSIMFRRAGRADEALTFLQPLAPRFAAMAWYQHELAQLMANSDRQAANAHYRRAVELDPANLQYHMALIDNLCRTRGVDEGAYLDEAYQALTKLPLEAQRKWSKIAAEILLLAADHDSAASLGGFAQLGREWATTGYHSALLGQMPRVETPGDRRELVEQHRLWGDLAREQADRFPIVRRPPSRRGSKIRLGFMSSDLREHVVGYFAWPLFEHADRDRFEIYCYSFYRGLAQPLQTNIASLVDEFRWHPSISDREAAQMIADDDIDILFELGGATHMNKIEVMAWKPARLAVSWLGYPHSAGLSTIDYLLVDPLLDPPDPALLIEKPLIMPKSWIAMSERAFPADHVIEPIAPVRRNGFITFGTANSPYKYNPTMLRVWARTMARTPGSHFIFIRPEGGSQVFVRNILARFEAEGISPDRIEFRAVRGAHMPHYNDIDIALDTFPQTGGTTTCEAAWMGVPTVTIVGEALFERMSYSILHNAGLGDLCAITTAEFIDIAVGLASDHDRLQALRTGLRGQLRASPLGQTEQFARDFYDLVARTVEASRAGQAQA